MELPYKYFIIDNKTKEVIKYTNSHYDIQPHRLQEYVPTKENPKVSKLEQTKTAYVDTRYDAKLRLYNYLRRKEGLPTYPPQYKPFEGTEIGKSIPILNF